MAVVVKDCLYILVHVPSFILYGPKSSRDIPANGSPDRVYTQGP